MSGPPVRSRFVIRRGRDEPDAEAHEGAVRQDCQRPVGIRFLAQVGSGRRQSQYRPRRPEPRQPRPPNRQGVQDEGHPASNERKPLKRQKRLTGTSPFSL